jgi:Skp family chaperone for outer membrane proteins
MAEKPQRRRSLASVEEDHLSTISADPVKSADDEGGRQSRLKKKRDKEAKEAEKEADRKAKEAAKIRERNPRRVTYEFDESLRSAVASIAEKHGTTASQVAAFLLTYALKQDVDLTPFLTPSESPRYKHNIDLDL